MNRMAEIFLAYSNGTQVAGGLGNTKISLQNLMSVTNLATVSSLVASEPVSFRAWDVGLNFWRADFNRLWLAAANHCICTEHSCRGTEVEAFGYPPGSIKPERGQTGTVHALKVPAGLPPTAGQLAITEHRSSV